MPTEYRSTYDQAIMKPAHLPRLKAALFIICLLPIARGAWIVLSGAAINPVEFIIRSLGTWGLTALLATLAITPLRRLSGWNWLVKLRRMLGLFAFFYISLHFAVYIWLDKFFELPAILRDIYKRPFITVGFAAFILLIPLAITSTDAMMRRLKRNWVRLHWLVYPIAMAGVLHYWWLVKRDHTQPLIYALCLALLLAARLWWRLRKAPAAT
ncbi:sulfite oxidase heme-binding subunit YedZ [Chitinimonas sp.]|uniref:sulfite oxidase heme-binding subunit YedZ n=1 Tax=Chitinimonas sp. TaxID=1934313 RepID=UPI0035AE91EF